MQDKIIIHEFGPPMVYITHRLIICKFLLLPGMKCVLSALSSIIVLTNLFSSKKNSPQLMLLSMEVCCGFSSSTNCRCIWRLNQNGRKTAVIVAMEAISKSRDASPRILLFIKFEMGSVIFGVRTTSVLGKLRGLPLPSMAAVLELLY